MTINPKLLDEVLAEYKKPEDMIGENGLLKQLTKALLEGARTEFPRRELTATVFDPEGERIGRATLSADGHIHWAR